MASELLITGVGAGKTTMAARVRRLSDIFVLNTTSGAFEVWSDANLATYRTAMADAGGGAYKANLPTLSGAVPLPAGTYLIEYEDTFLAGDQPTTEVFEWDGTARIRLASVVTTGDIDGYSMEEALRVLMAMLVGLISGAGTNTPIIKNPQGTKTRVNMITDPEGNRASVTLDVTP